MRLKPRWWRLLVTDSLDHHRAPHRRARVRVISGWAPAVLEFAPRPEFGQVAARLQAAAEGLFVTGTSDPMVLRSPGVAWDIITGGPHDCARAEVEPVPDRPVRLGLRARTTDLLAQPAQADRRHGQ